jgi:glycosyltransferase involved in cell wall biosynthesis
MIPGDPNSRRKPIAVCLIVSSLEFGGAERQVIEIATSLDPKRFKPIILSLSEKVPLIEGNHAAQPLLHILPKRCRFDLSLVIQVAKFLRLHKIEIAHAFLFDSEVVTRLASPLAGVNVVVASERNTDYHRPRLHHVVQKLTLPLIHLMVANSQAGANFNHRTLGLAKHKLRVVHNGVDTARFRPDPAEGLRFREQHGISTNHFVLGMVASFKRQKDHPTFLRTAKRVLSEMPECRFIIAGDIIPGSKDSETYSREIHDLANTLDLQNRCIFTGNTTSIEGIYNACDLTLLISLREGTPNAALESMACGRPVIASDVSDNRHIIRDGETGHIVPVGRDDLAADRVISLLSQPELLERMSRAARAHVCNNFTPAHSARKLEEIYLQLFQNHGTKSETREP